jgi:hypothetical protein
MSSKVMRQSIDDGANSRPSAIEFEMAYQARVAIDRIRFAIKHTEQFVPRTDHTREATLQLLDALQRLETVDRAFQSRSRNLASRFSAVITREAVNGHAGLPSHGRTTNSTDGTSRGSNSK